MSFENDFFAHMKTSVINTAASGGIYALLAPENVKTPFLVFSKVATDRSGGLCFQDAMQRDVIQLDSYDKAYLGATALAKVVRDTLIDFQGAMGSTHIGSIRFDGEIQNLLDEPGLYRVLTTLFVWHN